MILGMSIETLTSVHTIISLIAIATGVLVLLSMVAGYHVPGMTAVFLLTTILTSATGFLFPFQDVTPGIIIGAISLFVLAVALLALYVFKLSGVWKHIYVVTATVALYLNVLVAVVQAFQKLSALQPLAPTQSEPPFIAAQVGVLILFLILGALAVRRFLRFG
jgi:hypothetical protein